MLRVFVLWLLAVATISHDQNPCDTEQEHLGLIPSLLRLERTVTLLSTKLEKITADVISLKSELHDKDVLLHNFTRSIAKMETDVAYEVTLPSDMNNFHNNMHFKFPNVLFNKGGGYHRSSGIFTAPVTGTYMFWTHIMVNNKNSLHVTVYKDGVEIARGYTPGGILYGVASASTVTTLKQGEQVWIAKSGSSNLRGDQWSSYGGALLRSS